ncbi:MAG: hypothetical protein EBT33_06910 [Betaproteobacteria bacterium]|nr:hypothetical protein [Betaproteobacteria bacterium]
MSAPTPARTSTRKRLAWVFWVMLIGFVVWDFRTSAPIDLRDEPPLIAAGSGRSSTGGHCSMSK